MPLTLIQEALRHFFPFFNTALDRLPDRRDATRITSRVRHLLWLELLLFLSGAGSRHALVADSRRPSFLRALNALAGRADAAVAHPDTPYCFLRELPPAALLAFHASLIRRLLRMRCLEDGRVDGQWLVAIDGTWLHDYPKRHCPHCLHQRQPDGSLKYYHAVLEAKLVAGPLALSLGSVPLLNDDPAASKQDCELKAFLRLAPQLKAAFPRLPLVLLLDSLYGVAPVLAVCAQYDWSYCIVLKPGRSPACYAAAEAAAARCAPVVRRHPDGTVATYRYATNHAYGGTTVHAVFEHRQAPDGGTSTWAWLTDLRPSAATVARIAQQIGHRRWAIANEGFNAQKHGTLHLAHDFGSQGGAWYTSYLIAQVAHLLLQLLAHTDLIRHASGGRYGTVGALYGPLRGLVAALRAVLLTGGTDVARAPPLVPYQVRFLAW